MRFHQCTRRMRQYQCKSPLVKGRKVPYQVIAPSLPPHQLPIASCHRDMKFDSTLNNVARVPNNQLSVQICLFPALNIQPIGIY